MSNHLLNKAAEQSSAAIQIDNLQFSWPNSISPILNIKHFSIEEGEKIFLAGPSGSGKSTLLGILAGILELNHGSIIVNDYDLTCLSSTQRDTFRGDHIGFIFQQFNLIPYLTTLENITLSCYFSKVRAKNSVSKYGSVINEAKLLLARLDLDTNLWSSPANELSVGQQQRVAVARALIGSPKIIIADEPTSALDSDRRDSFLELLLSACDENNTTLLFVSHDLEISTRFSRVIHLQDINVNEVNHI